MIELQRGGGCCLSVPRRPNRCEGHKYEALRNANVAQQKREARNVIHKAVNEQSQYEAKEHARRNRKQCMNGGNEESLWRWTMGDHK